MCCDRSHETDWKDVEDGKTRDTQCEINIGSQAKVRPNGSTALNYESVVRNYVFSENGAASGQWRTATSIIDRNKSRQHRDRSSARCRLGGHLLYGCKLQSCSPPPC